MLGQGDRVDAEVEDRAATEREVEEPARRVEVALRAEVGLHQQHLPDVTGCDEVTEVGDGRLEARPHGLHAEHPGGAGGGDHLLGPGQRGREGLLDQQRRPGLDGGEGEVVVLGVRGREVDDVDVPASAGLDEVAVGARPGRPERSAKAAAEDGARLPTNAISASSVRTRSEAKAAAIPPVAAIPQRVVMAGP